MDGKSRRSGVIVADCWHAQDVAWRSILGTLKHTLTTSGPLRSCCKRRRGSAPDRAFVYWLSFISRWREEAEKWLHDMVAVLVIYVEFHYVCESDEKFQHMIYGTWSLLVRSLIVCFQHALRSAAASSRRCSRAASSLFFVPSSVEVCVVLGPADMSLIERRTVRPSFPAEPRSSTIKLQSKSTTYIPTAAQTRPLNLFFSW
jgi:hypothetical protein